MLYCSIPVGVIPRFVPCPFSHAASPPVADLESVGTVGGVAVAVVVVVTVVVDGGGGGACADAPVGGAVPAVTDGVETGGTAGEPSEGCEFGFGLGVAPTPASAVEDDSAAVDLAGLVPVALAAAAAAALVVVAAATVLGG